MDLDFLRKFIPHSELAVILENPEAYADELEDVEQQIRAMPTPEQLRDAELSDIKIGMHYFGGGTDFWVYALEPDGQYAEAFVCLNGDRMNAETGPIYIPELLPIALINLDLHWDSETRLTDIINRVKH